MNQFAITIKSTCTALGISQNELARRMQVSSVRVSHIMKSNNLSEAVVNRVADALGLRPVLRFQKEDQFFQVRLAPGVLKISHLFSAVRLQEQGKSVAATGTREQFTRTVMQLRSFTKDADRYQARSAKAAIRKIEQVLA